MSNDRRISKEYVCITLREANNGYGVTLSTVDGKQPIDEVHEERIEALKALKQWVDGEILIELKRRQSNASTM